MTRKMDFSDVILYLLARWAQDSSGYSIDTEGVCEAIYPLEEDLEELGYTIKFHESENLLHSVQISRALNELTPYRIPKDVSDKPFMIQDKVSNHAVQKLREKFDKDKLKEIEALTKNETFQEKMSENARYY